MPGTERSRWKASASWRLAWRTIESSSSEQLVVALEQGDVDGNALLHSGIREVLHQSLPVGRAGDPLLEGWQVVWVDRVLDVGEQLTSLANQVKPTPKEISGRPHLSRVDVGLGQHASPQQHRDLLGVDLVALGLAPVDGLHGERVAEHEGDLLLRTEIGEPVPGEGALRSDDQVIAVGSHELEEGLRLGAEIAMNQ